MTKQYKGPARSDRPCFNGPSNWVFRGGWCVNGIIRRDKTLAVPAYRRIEGLSALRGGGYWLMINFQFIQTASVNYKWT